MEEGGTDRFSSVKRIYDTQYKKLLVIPFALLIIAVILIGVKYSTTGEFVTRDVSLKGGVTVTIPTQERVDIGGIERTISSKFPNNDVETKSVSEFGKQTAIIVEADIPQEQTDRLISEAGAALGKTLTQNDYSIEVVGPSLGASFFQELSIALLIAFAFMAVVVFIYFRILIPSAAVILAALSDILVTVAIVNLLGMKLSGAGIAAFLMLIGYSVDTDILLSTRVLKRREGSVMDRVYGAMRTGMTMTITTLIAVTVALVITQSEIISQIMTILLIGLLVDLINTWIQNVGLLRLYLERKARKAEND